jgi:hypothetical protein
VAGEGEFRLDVAFEHVVHDLRGGLLAERPRPEEHRARVARDMGEQYRVGPRLGRTKPGHHQHWQRLDPRHQVGEPAEGRRIAPVQVVDREQQGPPVGDVGRQPEESVEH